MKKNTKRFVTCFLSALLLLTFVLANSKPAAAQEVHVINPDPEIIVLVPGETTKVKVPIRAVGSYISSPIILADATGTPYTVSQPVLRTNGIDVPMNIIYEFLDQYVEFDVTVAETAKIGNYPIKLNIYGTSPGDEKVTTELVVNTQILQEKEPAQLTVNKVTYDNTTIGKNMNLSFTVKNEGEITARNVYVSIDYGESGMVAGYSTKKIKVEDVASKKEVPINLPIRILPTASPGMNTITVNLTYKSEEGENITDSQDIYISLKANDSSPNLVLGKFNYTNKAKPGEKLGLVLEIKNDGANTAYRPRLSVDESSIGTENFIKNYYTDYIELKNIKSNNTIKVEVPLTISKEAKGGLKELKLNLVYFDQQGVEYKAPVTIYPFIEAEGISQDGTPVIVVKNVKQSPSKPVAGGRLEVSFDMENKSSIGLSDLKIGLQDLSGDTFIPVESDPYKYIGELKAGATKRITIPLKLSENIQEGLNTLTIGYSYAGGSDKVDIPVLNVENDLGSASKPRLIVSDYNADIEVIKAGSVFNFNFEVRNTHSSVAAKNIIISVSGKSPQDQSEIFTVTQGSNSFFVSKIGPGETVSNTLELKAKSDAATFAYPLTVSIEYEYDGIEPNPTTGQIGEKEEHELTLQVIENARPVVDYVQVYSYDGQVVMGNPATVYFDFFNMGKSTLNNVIATIEGDFTSTSGNMYFIGNVNAGESSSAEFEVIPNIEGMAQGIVKITYEDSNGDEQVYTKEFETTVMGEMTWDPGFDEGSDVFNPMIPEPKKAILPTWAFILIQVAIFAIFVPVTRKVIISLYKSRLLKKEEEMYQ
jgi:hypothetical protein